MSDIITLKACMLTVPFKGDSRCGRRHHTGGGNSSYMQRLVKGDFRCVFHAAFGKRLMFFHVKVGTDILLFCLP